MERQGLQKANRKSDRTAWRTPRTGARIAQSPSAPTLGLPAILGNQAVQRLALSGAGQSLPGVGRLDRPDLMNPTRAISNSSGWPLPARQQRAFAAEGLPDTAVRSIRIHTDTTAARSARLLGATAYQYGNHIVFGANSYKPGASDSDVLLRHEVAHVGQTGGRTNRTLKVAPRDSRSEIEARDFAIGGRDFGSAKLTLTQPACHLTADPRLGDALHRIRGIPMPFTAQEKARRIREILRGIDLNDPDNLEPLIMSINGINGASEGGEILVALLSLIDSEAVPRELPQRRSPTPEEEARMQRQIEMMQIGPRGPYRQYGVGVLAPLLSQPARHLLPLLEAAGNAFAGAGAFVEGVLVGLRGSMTEKDRERLARRLLQSYILNAVFPIVFVAGAAVGIVEDVIEAVRGIYGLITNLRQFVEDMVGLFRAFVGPDSRAIGRAMGEEVGREYGRQVAALAHGNIFEFTFGLGRMIGPTIVYTVLAFLGVPELVASALISRLLSILRPLLQRFPRLLAIAERIAGRIARQATNRSATELDADLERSFGQTFTEPAPSITPGQPTLQPPEVSAGFAARHLAAFRRLLGRTLTHPEVNDLARVWASAANPGEAATLTLQNSRRLFDNQRGRFWRAVRNDPAARRIFTDAGCVFEGRTSTAPFYRRADGSRFEMTIDHIIERQTDPRRALDPANLQIVSRRENTVMLRQLHNQSPFLQ